MKPVTKKFFPHVTAIVIFLVISVVYMYPALEGKKLQQGDITNFLGMSKEIKDYEAKTGEQVLWTNSMFGGMPSYLIGLSNKANKTRIIHIIITINNWRPISFLFLYFIGFYLALLMFRVNPWVSMVGALAYTFSSYFFIIVEAGHTSKAMALGYMPPIIAGVYYAYRGKVLWGSMVVGIFLALQLLVNHLQITYYSMIIVIFLVLFLLYDYIRKNQFNHFLKVSLILLIPVVLAVGSNFATIWTTLEYGAYSMRGKTELTHDEENITTGLDKDYALQWSYGVSETMTLLIPNFKGGSSNSDIGTDSETYEVLRRGNVPNARNIIKQMPTYFGAQPFTSGPVYVGAIVVFLFVMGLFIIRGPVKWWILTVTVLSILLAWGSNFKEFSYFFLDHIPGYNKFRTVSMILVIAQFTIPLLGFLAIREIYLGKVDKKSLLKYTKYTLYIVGGLTLLVTLFPGIAGDFSSAGDQRLPEPLLEPLRADRENMVQMDALRSFIFILLVSALTWAYATKKIQPKYALLLLGLLILVDMWAVNKRYLDEDNFVREKKVEQPFVPYEADKVIFQDEDPYFRVLDLTTSTFNSSRASYFHQSIGGYHGAKMQRYQDLIEFHISPEMNTLVQEFNNEQRNLNNTLDKLTVLNMLNTKYIIYNPQAPPLVNREAMGNAWFVDSLIWVDNADQEIASIENIQPDQTAVIDKKFKDLVTISPNPDSAASIQLKTYSPDELVFTYEINDDQIAVFSDIYYPKGWNAYIDGEMVPHFRVNYVLRAMQVPQGKNEIVFKFEPTSFYKGKQVSLASSLILILLFLGLLGKEIKRKAANK
jgi:hypothetical protein